MALISLARIASGQAGVLPGDGFLGRFHAEPTRSFVGANLYAYIDGGAEIFFELGFDGLTLARFTAGDEHVTVESYLMADSTAALAIYLEKCGSETPIAGFAERHTAGAHQLMMVKGAYFVAVNFDSGGRGRSAVLAAFARAIAARLPDGPEVPEVKLLPTQGLQAGSVRLIRGPVGLSGIATLGDGDILQLGGKVTAVAGQYTGPEGPLSFILATYPDAAHAASAFRNLRVNLDREIEPLVWTDSRLVFRDYDGSFGVGSLEGTRLEIRLHLKRQPPLHS